MAFSGVHIVFRSPAQPDGISSTLPSGASVSQSMVSAGTSTISAPFPATLLSISASAPVFYATGPNPDPSLSSSSRCYYDPAGGREDIFVSEGDKFAWILA